MVMCLFQTPGAGEFTLLHMAVWSLNDDFENEFVYLRSRPLLFVWRAVRIAVYLGTFSRLLLTSIRISFMVLPQSCLHCTEKADQYNQTASKAEQIALCQFVIGMVTWHRPVS